MHDLIVNSGHRATEIPLQGLHGPDRGFFTGGADEIGHRFGLGQIELVV